MNNLFVSVDGVYGVFYLLAPTLIDFPRFEEGGFIPLSDQIPQGETPLQEPRFLPQGNGQVFQTPWAEVCTASSHQNAPTSTTEIN